MSRLIRATIGLVILVFVAAGCGGTGTGGGATGEKPAALSPRPGEDIMKDAMEKLKQKGKAIPGMPKSTVKHG